MLSSTKNTSQIFEVGELITLTSGPVPFADLKRPLPAPAKKALPLLVTPRLINDWFDIVLQVNPPSVDL